MIEFVSLENYFEVYIYFALFLVVFNLFHAYILDMENPKYIRFMKVAGIILLLIVVLYMGLRPISGRYFGDMVTYNRYFEYYKAGGEIYNEKDILFQYYIKIMSQLVSAPMFFLFTAFLYIFPMYKLSKKLFPKYWFYSFFIFVVSFSFWSYGVNGIRNGVATSMFLLALCFYDKKIIMASFFILAALFHKTLLLPILAFYATVFYNNPKTYMKVWLAAIPLSLVMGGVWISLFTSLGFGDDRLSGYLTGEVDASAFSSTGFRWDFVIYSASAVFAGWYFIYKKKFEDKFYNHLLGTYLICNAFWILVIRANYSNRFAYLSWFLIGLIIIYPYLKNRFFTKQQIVTAKVTTVYFLFTFFMYFIYYGR